jgi:hypothetical protein
MSGTARLRVGAVALLTFVVIAGTTAASSPSLRLMVLGLNNLPAGYAQDYSHSASKADVRKEQGFVMPGYVTGSIAGKTCGGRGGDPHSEVEGPATRQDSRPQRV